MAYCIENKKLHRCNGEIIFHVLDLIQSTMISAKTNKPIKIKSTCKIPKYFSQKRNKKNIKINYANWN